MSSQQQTWNNPYDLNPLSYASTIIGFVSFVFTLLTLLRVIWGNIIGLWEAPDEIRYTFANLKSALLEERAHCRTAWRSIVTQLRYERDQDLEDRKIRRRHSSRGAGGGKGHRRRRSSGKSAAGGGHPYTPTLAEAGAEGYGSDADDDNGEKAMARAMDQAANWKVLYGTVKRLCKQFSEIEQPFLKQSVKERRYRINQEWHQEPAGEKAAKYSDVDSDEEPGMMYDEASIAIVRARHGHYITEDYLKDYVSFDFRHRYMWLRVRSRVEGIANKLQGVQIRRASAEITQVLRGVATIEAGLRDLRLIQGQQQHQHGRSGGERRRDGERWERVHVRRSVVQDE